VLKRHGERGDTLIEVLVAFGVFSLAVVGSIAVMNQGSYLAQRALETTLVRDEINSQAEALRFLHDAYLASYQPGLQYDASAPASPTKEWLAMKKQIETGTNHVTDLSQYVKSCPTAPTGSFVLDSQNGAVIAATASKIVDATSYAQLVYTTSGSSQVFSQSQGVWVEANQAPTNTADSAQSHIGYTDFYIFACWPSIGQDKVTTLGTTVRLYEPR
jgi:type II secretory pathway pseudopilin PulG